MTKNRLEAFSDGVLAIIITIMVLEMKVPHGNELSTLTGLGPVFLSYVLSFAYVGIYWNNHHHMFHAVQHVTGPALWANLHLLFWLSLFPFVTGWMGENHFSMWPVALYGFVLLMAAIAYSILIAVLRRHNTALDRAVGKDAKGWLSILLYMAGIGAAFIHQGLAVAIYGAVAAMWFIPDRRIEKTAQ